MPELLRVGIVGCGGIARVHANAYRELPGLALRAVYDVVPGLAQRFAATYGFAAGCDDWDAFCAAGLDVVSVCTPHPTHPEYVERLAVAGVHPLVEKPLAVDCAGADRAIVAARRAGVRLGVIFQRRYWPAARRLKAAIAAGRLGRPVRAECVAHFERTTAYFASGPWRGKWATEGGGVLVNQAPHLLDLLQWLMGPVESLSAHWGNLTHPEVEVETVAVATVRFQSGALGTINVGLGRRAAGRGFTRVAVHGDSGAWASVHEEPEGAPGLNREWVVPGEEEEGQRRYEIERASAAPTFRTVDLPGIGPTVVSEYHRLQIADFLAAVRAGREPELNGEEGRKTVELIEAIYRSGRTGQPVRLPLAARP